MSSWLDEKLMEDFRPDYVRLIELRQCTYYTDPYYLGEQWLHLSDEPPQKLSGLAESSNCPGTDPLLLYLSISCCSCTGCLPWVRFKHPASHVYTQPENYQPSDTGLVQLTQLASLPLSLSLPKFSLSSSRTYLPQKKRDQTGPSRPHRFIPS